MVALVGPEGVGPARTLTNASRVVGGDLPVKAIGADGGAVDAGAARFLPFDHVEGGLLVFDAPPAGAVAVEIPGYGLLPL